MSQHISWNSSFWHVSEIVNDRSAAVNSVLFGRAGRDERERQYGKDRQ